MPHKIIAETCNACGECEIECPNDAISPKGQVFAIDPTKCKDCAGTFDSPQCVDICKLKSIVPVAT